MDKVSYCSKHSQPKKKMNSTLPEELHIWEDYPLSEADYTTTVKQTRINGVHVQTISLHALW